jgi:hypothetical protein
MMAGSPLEEFGVSQVFERESTGKAVALK